MLCRNIYRLFQKEPMYQASTVAEVEEGIGADTEAGIVEVMVVIIVPIEPEAGEVSVSLSCRHVFHVRTAGEERVVFDLNK
jgi:hypothetical protein